MTDYADRQQIESILNRVLLNDSVMKITTPYMRFYELEALCALGEQSRVLQEMRSYWGGMLREGATTFWETYDPSETFPKRLAMYGQPYGKSLCHAWGASPVYLLGEILLGCASRQARLRRMGVQLLSGRLEVDAGRCAHAEGEHPCGDAPQPYCARSLGMRHGLVAVCVERQAQGFSR